MKNNLIMAICAVYVISTMVVACGGELTPVNEESNERVTLSVYVPDQQTKLTTVPDEVKISNYQVFVYNSSDVLEAYANRNSSEITMECTVGPMKIVVIVNAPAISAGVTYEELVACRSLLSDNSPGRFVMVGIVSETLTSTSSSVTVPVSRLVSKVRLAHLETAFEMPQYRSMPFKISSVYLINVPADCGYLSSGPVSEWYNKSGYDSGDENGLIYDDMNDIPVSPASPYGKVNTFYCYSNPYVQDSFQSSWSARRTRLVVEAQLGTDRYCYPVTLPVLEANKIYDVSLTVTRPGADNPDNEVDKYSVGFKITVCDWVAGESVNAEI